MMASMADFFLLSLPIVTAIITTTSDTPIRNPSKSGIFTKKLKNRGLDLDLDISIIAYDGRILFQTLCRQTLLWYTIFIFIFKQCRQLNILKIYFVYMYNYPMKIITSMRMLINDGYSSNKVEKSLQKVLQNFYNSLRKILRLFPII